MDLILLQVVVLRLALVGVLVVVSFLGRQFLDGCALIFLHRLPLLLVFLLHSFQLLVLGLSSLLEQLLVAQRLNCFGTGLVANVFLSSSFISAIGTTNISSS